MISNVRCLFEQSGHFRDAFRRHNIAAYDYDISDEFGQTNYQVDLFKSIEDCFDGKTTVFDTFEPNDLLFAFFPCTRFSDQFTLQIRGVASGQSNDDNIKAARSISLINEVAYYYSVLNKLVLICLERNLKLIIENPYGSQHFLTRYWCFKPSVIHRDRHDLGDFFIKPTQYFFFNCEPSNNFVLACQSADLKIVQKVSAGISRSLISPDYCNYFIESYIL